VSEPYVETRTMYRYHVIVRDTRTANKCRVYGRWDILACTKRDAEDATKDTVSKTWGFPDTIEFIATRTGTTPTEVAVVCH
jgi:hypothetical protein